MVWLVVGVGSLVSRRNEQYIHNCSECDKDHKGMSMALCHFTGMNGRLPSELCLVGGSMKGLGSWGHSGGASAGQGIKGQEREVEGREGTARVRSWDAVLEAAGPLEGLMPRK